MPRLSTLLGRFWSATHVIGYVLLLLATAGAIAGLGFFAQQTAQLGLVLLLMTLIFRRNRA